LFPAVLIITIFYSKANIPIKKNNPLEYKKIAVLREESTITKAIMVDGCRKRGWGLFGMLGLIIILLVSGCATAATQDEPAKDRSADVRVSGDVIVSAVNRKGF